MILHVVCFRWRAGVDAAAVSALVRQLEELPRSIPGLVRYRFGPDLGRPAATGDFAIVAEVRDEEALAAYLDHPAHQAVRGVLGEMAESREAVQLAWAERPQGA